MVPLRRPAFLIAPLFLASLVAGCDASATAVSPGGVIQVVAAENFWGSIASQLGGGHASVLSIVTDPNADPHEYESNTNDARAIATANVVIVNGAGYDDWATQLLDASPSASRVVLNVAQLLGKKDGDNPHFWYSQAYVHTVIDQIVADYRTVDPGDAAYFASQRSQFLQALQPEEALIAAIRQQDAGRAVGATESIFVYLSQSLGLDLISPPGFMQAVAEGNEPSAADVATMQNQVSSHAIWVLVYNVQTVTAVTTDIEDLARQHGVAVVGISETIQPPTARFQDWQMSELRSLQSALASIGGT